MLNIHFIIQFILLTIFFICLFNLFTYNKIKEGATTETDSTDKFTSFDTQESDAIQLQSYMNNIKNTKNKISGLRNYLYRVDIKDILQLKPVLKEKSTLLTSNNHKFNVTIDSSNNFKNIITIEIPEGEKGPDGEEGEEGDIGVTGSQGNRGPEGYCGQLNGAA